MPRKTLLEHLHVSTFCEKRGLKFGNIYNIKCPCFDVDKNHYGKMPSKQYQRLIFTTTWLNRNKKHNLYYNVLEFFRP